ncbi:unnamed protein product, partial [Rotaria magnacalcarata]
VEENNSENKENPKIFVPKIVILNNLKPSPNSNPNRAPPRNPTPNPQPVPNPPNSNGGTVVNVGAIAAANYTVQGKDMPNLNTNERKNS